MVIDSSALISIVFEEPDFRRFRSAIDLASIRLVGAPTRLETTMVVAGRLGPAAREVLERLLQSLSAEVVAFTPKHATRAVDAFLQYGKGRHPARLNFGDCCSYALAAETGLPLLYKGNDFSRTDILPALAP